MVLAELYSDNILTGTGTPTGDPIEANAVGSVFGKWRSSNDPLYLYVSKRAPCP